MENNIVIFGSVCSRKKGLQIYAGLVSVAVLVLLLFPGCPYYSPAFRGRVIDAETEEPIEGAAVVAVYRRRTDCLCCCIPLWPVGGSCRGERL